VVRITLSYETQEEREKFIADMFRHKDHKIKSISKEYQGKGKSSYRKIYIELSSK
jgi:hypothetical protein